MPTQKQDRDPSLLDEARQNISLFVLAQAAMRERRLGFSCRASAQAPSSYGALLEEFRAAELSGLALRVSSLHNDPVIYDTPAVNLAFRYWHDTSHVLHGLSFDLEDELDLADHHLEALRAEGFGPDTVEHQLLYADTFGQAYFQLCTGQFVANQVRFDTNCVLFGIDEALNQELDALRTAG